MYLYNYPDFMDSLKINVLKVASYLTEPVCKVREYRYTLHILDQTCKKTLEKAMRAAWLVFGMMICALLTPVTAPLGIAIRGAVATLEAKPYIYLKRGEGLPTPRELTVLSHNQCYMPAGYSITDGQVTPFSERMEANLKRVRELNPDLICLYEVADICDGSYISSQLPEYPFVIPVAGVRAVGPSSMLYVASKYEIDPESIEFVPFVKDVELTGRARFSEKGFLSFDLCSEKVPFATVITTHLQHSEVPADPSSDDKTSRARQMEKIARKIEVKVQEGKTVIFTGDLNAEESEVESSRLPQLLKRDARVQGVPTWGGDSWCKALMKEPSSGPLVLDYAFVSNKGTITTQVIDVGYSGSEFRRDAGSDHSLLFSKVELHSLDGRCE